MIAVKAKKFFTKKRLLKCGKGAISLILAVLMTPFLTVAMVLVETQRFNSAVSILDESMGVSAYSLLANYDEYLQNRWGLYAVDQTVDMHELYENYLKPNSEIMGNAIQVNDIGIEGQYSLEDMEIFKDQIMEFCKLNAPGTVAAEMIDIDSILKSFKAFKVIEKFIGIFTKMLNLVNSVIKYLQRQDDLRDIKIQLAILSKKYITDYANLKKSVTELKTELGKTRPTKPEDAAVFDQNIQSLREKVSADIKQYDDTVGRIMRAAKTYEEVNGEAKKELQNMKTNTLGVVTEAQKIDIDKQKEEKDKLEKEIEKMEKDGTNVSNPTAYTQATERYEELQNDIQINSMDKQMVTNVDNMTNTIISCQEEYEKEYEEKTENGETKAENIMEITIRHCKSISEELNKIDVNAIDKDFELDDKKLYESPVMGKLDDQDKQNLELELQSKLDSADLRNTIKTMISFLEDSLKINGIFDYNLSSVIDTKYYNDNVGGLPGAKQPDVGPIAIFRDIEKIISNATDLPEFGLIRLAYRVKNIIEGVISLIKDIISFFKMIINNIVNLFTDYTKIYSVLYAANNLPCRTDCLGSGISFTSMSGKGSLKSGSLPEHKIADMYDKAISLKEILSEVNADTPQKLREVFYDLTFSGAELEYVLFGSNNEIANQVYVFMAIFYIRAISDAVAIASNPEAQTVIGSSTLLAPVVLVVMLIVEPICDMLLLVNGGSVDFYKTTIFLTPTGIPEFLSGLFSIFSTLTDKQKEQLGKGLCDSLGANYDDVRYMNSPSQKEKEEENKPTTTGDKVKKKFKDKGKALLEMNYKDYCFVMLLFTVDEAQTLSRIQNLVQMESTYYFKNVKKNGKVFDLRKSYTYVKIDVDASVKQMLPSLADSSLFDIQRTMYRGY